MLHVLFKDAVVGVVADIGGHREPQNNDHTDEEIGFKQSVFFHWFFLFIESSAGGKQALN